MNKWGQNSIFQEIRLYILQQVIEAGQMLTKQTATGNLSSCLKNSDLRK
jgi:hypothetical protein